jgi:hypothetical protein
MAPTHEPADPLALALVAQLRDRSLADRRFVYRAYAARLLGDMPVKQDLAINSLLACTHDVEAPSRRQYDKWRSGQDVPGEWLPSTSIRDAFKGWANALDAAGIKPAPDVLARRLGALGPAYSRDELLVVLRLCASDHGGRSVSRSLYRQWACRSDLDLPTRPPADPDTIARHFGGWQAAWDAAGTSGHVQRRPKPRRGPVISDDHALGDLARAIDDLGFQGISMAKYSRWRAARLEEGAEAVASDTLLKQRFGGFRNAVALAYPRAKRWERPDREQHAGE